MTENIQSKVERILSGNGSVQEKITRILTMAEHKQDQNGLIAALVADSLTLRLRAGVKQ